MKYFFFCLALAFSVASCQNGCGTGNGGDNAGKSLTSSTHRKFTPPTDSTTRRVFDIFAHDYWVVTGYHKIGVKGASRANRGRWYQFRPDGTFTVGYFDKVLSTGTWNLEQNGTHMRLDAQDVSEDGLWRMQINSDGSIAVWVGTEEFQTTGVQQRLENLLFAPKSPSEMGWDQ